MSDNTQKALEAKTKGNAAFSAKKYEEAVGHFTEAISLDPSNHILYSNRSACYASLKNFESALEDANKTVGLKPDWSKGYLRQGTALNGLTRFDDALDSCHKGLEIEPTSDLLKDLRQDIEEAKNPAPKGGSMFGPEAMVKLAMDPRTRDFVNQPDFMFMLQDMQKNPSNMTKYFADKRISAALSVILGFDMSTMGDMADMEDTPMPQVPRAEPPKPAEPPKKAAPVVVEVSEGQKARESGNAAYKAKDFERAISEYDRAYSLDDKDILSLNNKAAVFLEQQRLDECIALCQKAIERCHEIRADYKIKSKVLTRLGNAYMKQDNLVEALRAYNSAIVEDKNAETMANLNRAEKLKKERDEKSYINPELSAAAKAQGNEHFKKGEFPEAIKAFEEAIRRNPSDHTIYSNRSACYAKLGEYLLAIKDADKVIEMAPTFIKGYIRKATGCFAMREFQRVLEVCDQGLRIEENNSELVDWSRKAVFALNKQQDSMTDEERLEAASKNPEIAAILQDPIMNQILKDMQGNPAAIQEHLKNPGVRAKFDKLVAAGIVKLGR
eukprot:gene15856-18842_t